VSSSSRKWNSRRFPGGCNTKCKGLVEEPGLCDNHDEDPYGESAPENILDHLRRQAGEKAA